MICEKCYALSEDIVCYEEHDYGYELLCRNCKEYLDNYWYENEAYYYELDEEE